MIEEQTTAVLHSANSLAPAGMPPPEPIIRPLLDRAVRRLMCCA